MTRVTPATKPVNAPFQRMSMIGPETTGSYCSKWERNACSNPEIPKNRVKGNFIEPVGQALFQGTLARWPHGHYFSCNPVCNLVPLRAHDNADRFPVDG